MTVIACNQDMMAGDSQWVDGGIVGKCGNDERKIRRINGDLVGFAGNMQDGLQFLDWYKDQTKDKPSLDSFSGLVLKPDGTILLYETALIPTRVHPHPFYAIGNGAEFALGAMYAGAQPDQAVRLCCKHMDGIGGPVRVLKRR